MTKDDVIDIIKDAGFGFFATAEGNQPRVRPMMPILANNNELLIAALGQCRSLAQIAKNPQVEICFVDRKMWYCRVSGKASASNDQTKKSILWNAIPMLKQYFGGPEDPNFKLIVVAIEHIEAMTPHQMEPESVV